MGSQHVSQVGEHAVSVMATDETFHDIEIGITAQGECNIRQISDLTTPKPRDEKKREGLQLFENDTVNRTPWFLTFSQCEF